MKNVLLTITAPTAVLATAQISETNATQSNGFEFLAGINSGASISWYDIGKKDLTANMKTENSDLSAWNAVSILKTKLVPFLEAEFATQYLINNVFIGMSIAGGSTFGKKYTENGYKYFDSTDTSIKLLLNMYYGKKSVTIARQKYHLSFMPYIGYRTNPQTDIYLTCGLKMVATKYFNLGTKRTYHPMLGIGACYRFTDNWFCRIEGCYVFPKKKKLSGNIKVTYETNTYNIENKVSVKHAGYVFKLGFGYRF